MGKVEIVANYKRRNARIQKIILSTVATTGFLAVALIAPNALQVLSMFDGGRKRKKNPRYLIKTTFVRLLEKGYLTLDESPKGKFARLTPEGRRALAFMVARSPDARKHKRWDKRWRMVMYDIKEERKTKRMRLVETLKSFGFLKLQNSVWIYPHDCEELVTLLKADFKLGTEVLYVVVEHIENDNVLKAHFGLE